MDAKQSDQELMDTLDALIAKLDGLLTEAEADVSQQK